MGAIGASARHHHLRRLPLRPLRCNPDRRDGSRQAHLLRGVYHASRQQGDEFARLGLEFRSLWGRPLQLVDCQNLFCEVDKYARVAHPDIAGRSGRTRIKQRFVPSTSAIRYWYPPKWGINDAVGAA